MATLNIKSFPEALYGKLQKRAEREHRSLSQEVVHLLSKAVEDPERPSILELRGLGKEVWNADAVELVRRGERLVVRSRVAEGERSKIDVARLIEEERDRWPG